MNDSSIALGDFADITITGVVITAWSGDILRFVTKAGGNIEIPAGDPSITVTKAEPAKAALPADWPPVPGDVWRVGTKLYTCASYSYGGVTMRLANVDFGAGCAPDDMHNDGTEAPELLHRVAPTERLRFKDRDGHTWAEKAPGTDRYAVSANCTDLECPCGHTRNEAGLKWGPLVDLEPIPAKAEQVAA